MEGKVTVNYRGRNLNLDKSNFDLYLQKRGRRINSIDIDQYVLNELDKTDPDPLNVDYETLASRFTNEELEKITDTYIKQENDIWK